MTLTVNIEAVHACLSSLGLLNVVDASVFYNELEQQAAKYKIDQPIPPPPPLTPSRWITALPPELVIFELPPYATSSTTIMGKGPDPKTMKFMIEETKAMLDREAERLKRTLPIDAPITSPLLSYDQLRFQRFMVHVGFSGPLYMCNLAYDSLDENVKEGMGESASLPMDLVMWGSSTTISGSVTIHPASQMPQQITPFIFGRKFVDLLKEYPALPVAIDDSQRESHS